MVVYNAIVQYRALISCSSGFEICNILRGEFVSPSQNPQPEGLGLRIYVPADSVAQLYR